MTEFTDQGESTMAYAELRALFDAAVDAIVVTDEDGRILAFNKAAERLFGHAAQDVIGKGVDVLMPEPDHNHHAGYMERYLETGHATIIGIGREIQARRASGEVFPVALSVGEAVAENRRRFVGIIRDLSAAREQERRRRALEARLAHFDRFNLMGEMAAGIAHEINQPLSAIATYAQAAKRVLQREPVNAAALVEICEKIDGQARRAGQVIENVRKFTRRQESRVELVDVNSTISDVRSLMEADARRAGISIETHCSEALPLVRADAAQLQQVLLNLTRNAVDAMLDNLHARRIIHIETGLGSAGEVQISVIDHGPGVSKSLGDNIFHPFVTTKEEGLGVGLAVSLTIVRALGGRLAFEDNPQGGAIFRVELPAARTGEERPAEGAER